MRKIDHHHCSGVPCNICGPDPRDAEIARLKAEVFQARQRADSADAKIALSKEIVTAFEAIPDIVRKSAATLPETLAEVERWKMHHAQQVKENRSLKAEVERLTEVARLLVGECEEQRECPVCGTDTNVEECRPSCYVAKMRKVLDGGKGCG